MSNVDLYGDPPIDVSETTWRMYSQGIPSAAQAADSQQLPTPYPLLQYMSLVGDQMGQVEDLLDDITYISPANGGPPAGSDELYSYSTLVDPWEADPTWLPWLAMVTGTNINGLNQVQARLAIASQQTYGKYQGSKTAIQEAIRSLFAFEVPNATAVAGTSLLDLPLPAGLNLPIATDNLFNAGESSYIGDPSWQNWSPVIDGIAVPIITPSSVQNQGLESLLIYQSAVASDFLGIQLNRNLPVLPNQSYALSFSTMAAVTNTASVSPYAIITYYNSSGLLISSTTTSYIHLVDGVWSLYSVNVTTPANTATVTVQLAWSLSGNVTTGAVYVNTINLIGSDPYGSLKGALLFGQGVAVGATIQDIMATPNVLMSTPTVGGIQGNVVVVPNVPVAVIDHYGSSPVTTWLPVNPADSGASMQNLVTENAIVSVPSPLARTPLGNTNISGYDYGPNGYNLVSAASVTAVSSKTTAFGNAASMAGGYLLGTSGSVGAGVITGSAMSAECRIVPASGDLNTGAEVLSYPGQWYLAINGTNDHFAVYWYDSSATIHQQAGSITISGGTTYSEQISWDGTTVRLFTNGQLDATISVSSILAAGHYGAQSFTIGAPNVATNSQMDEVRISTVARNTTSYTPSVVPFQPDSNTNCLYHLDMANSAFNQAVYAAAGPTQSVMLGPAGSAAAQGAITPATGWTAECWYSPAGGDEWSIGRWPRTGGNGEWNITVATTGGATQVYGYFVNSGASIGSATSAASACTPDIPVHLALTYSSASVGSLWVNGQPAGTVSVPTLATPSASVALTLFGSINAGTQPQGGVLDEVRISNTARYSASFTPPTGPFTNDANTEVIYHLDAGPVTVTTLSGLANPWGIGVFVPVGIPLAAAYNAALSQKPAGYSLTLLYTYADWANLYSTFGNGTSISWSEIAGLSWQTLEQTT